MFVFVFIIIIIVVIVIVVVGVVRGLTGVGERRQGGGELHLDKQIEDGREVAFEATAPSGVVSAASRSAGGDLEDGLEDVRHGDGVFLIIFKEEKRSW